MARKFEKISKEQFFKDTSLTEKEYNSYSLPSRSTNDSAGYDFQTLTSFTLNPGETKLISTGIKAKMNKGEVLLLFIRSSLGFKYNIRMCNQTGVIDKDYYNNVDNEGHIFVKLKNEGNKPKEFKQNEKFIQGIFIKYLTIDNEQEIQTTRKGGIGSTNEKN